MDDLRHQGDGAGGGVEECWCGRERVNSVGLVHIDQASSSGNDGRREHGESRDVWQRGGWWRFDAATGLPVHVVVDKVAGAVRCALVSRLQCLTIQRSQCPWLLFAPSAGPAAFRCPSTSIILDTERVLVVRVRAKEQVESGVKIDRNLLRDVLVEIELLAMPPAACLESTILAPL